MADTKKTDGSLALQEKQYRVITIDAAEKPQDIKLRVAAYARVSSSSEDQLNSYTAQNSYYRELITGKDNWRLVDIYADKGITGTSAEKRGDFQRLLAACRRGLIDRVLVKSISRFARNTTECLEAIRELKLLGISVFFEKENIDTATMTGEMMTALFASLAQGESQSISSNMRWSFQRRMESGTFVPMHQPFGYVLIDKQIEIDSQQAIFVCEIYSAYLSGWNTDQIAEYLNGRQIEHPELCGRVWTSKAVARILKNEKYTGDSIWQKSYRTDSLPTKEKKNRGEHTRYYAKGTHPAIIDSDCFQQVQALLSKRNSYRTTGNGAAKSIFQGKSICGCCGAPLRTKISNKIEYRACRNHERASQSCPLKPIPDTEIAGAFLRLYYKLKHHGEPILNQMLSQLLDIRNRRMLWSVDIVELNKQISDLSSQNQVLTELKQQGLIDPDIFIAQSNGLAEQLRAAKLQKERLLNVEGDHVIAQTQELIEIIEAGPDFLDSFDAELFGELVDMIIVDSNEQIRFRLKNGLELTETVERTVR